MSQSLQTRSEFGSVSSTQSTVSHVKGSGALGNLTSQSGQYVLVQTTGASTATLGTAAIGKVKTVVLAVDAGDLIVTPSVVVGGTTVTLADAGDSFTAVMTSAGWVITSNVGCVVA